MVSDYTCQRFNELCGIVQGLGSAEYHAERFCHFLISYINVIQGFYIVRDKTYRYNQDILFSIS